MTSARRRSNLTYGILVVILAVLSAANLYLPQGDFVPTMPTDALPAPKAVIALAVVGLIVVLYGGLGWLGLLLARRLGWPDLWTPAVSNRQRFLIPAVAGAVIGLFLIGGDAIFSRIGAWGALPHPPFPTSLVASASAGIGEEIIFRLFFVALWTWLISALLLRGRGQTTVFWIVAVVAALAFGAGHFPAVMVLFGYQTVTAIPPLLLGEILLLNGVLGIVAAVYLRTYGFLAAVGVHFWTDIIWHVFWGIMGS